MKKPTKLQMATVIVLSGAAAVGCGTKAPAAEQGYNQPAQGTGSESAASAATGTSSAPQQPTAASVNAAQSGSLRDAQIVKILEVANTGEVKQAELAEQKAKNLEVRNFAAMMIKHHNQAKQEAQRHALNWNFGKEDSRPAGELENEASQTLATLQTSDASAFDKAYIDAQVRQHQEVLQLVERQLIPAATNPQLQSELEKTRELVQKHLRAAQQIDDSLAAR